ncbi:MAG: M48 family metallopeptidase [Candidatus Kapabacteria bacterium]|nr:M48 family metallopeptidase [Ignavibacteria bacterium]MBL0321386.1 M48 family metallopeptidase [Ignavibacteria bacterium]MBP6510282.1 M48 family metallopeptidase [Candidatus Kapabacteria bacterium]
MMPLVQSFAELCVAVRYSGDRPRAHARSTSASTSVIDQVAQIRSTALQVTSRTVPLIHRACERVAERLLLQEAAEVYVVAEPTPNAFAPAWASGDRPIVVLHSGLVQLLSATEIEFVIGHELGHLGMRHGALFANAASSEFERLQARSFQRAAEISADRIGLLACRSIHLTASVMIKTASGLPSEHLGIDIGTFVAQMDRDPAEISREWELDLTHPSLPLRLWALLRFAHADRYAVLSGQGASGAPMAIIDSEIDERMQKIGDGALTAIEEDVYLKALTWAGLSLVMADSFVQPEDETALIQLVGADLARKAIDFATTHGRTAVDLKYTESVQRLASVGTAIQERFRVAEEAFRFTIDQSRKQ